MTDSTPQADRTVRSAEDIDRLVTFDAAGLVPVVAQDVSTGAVLMVAWANLEAVQTTLATGQAHFWSRSRGELWRKGATSGNTLDLVSMHGDCDADTLLMLVRPAGPACHTGDATCFGSGATPKGHPTDPPSNGLDPDGGKATTRPLRTLDSVLAARAADRPEGSYTVRLLDDPNLRLKKLGEETAELVAALATGDRARALEEAADLMYHTLVALRAEGLGLDALEGALEDRAG